MRYDVLVVGGGTAGCVLASRLSEDPDRSVCLVEAGPDYGPLSAGHWPADMLDARFLPTSHDWGTGGEDNRSLGARILGGCSAHNACCVLAGAPEDYDEWGPEWAYARFEPYLARARATLRTARANTDRPGAFHAAFVEAAQAASFPLLSDPDDPTQPLGVAPFPANAVDGTRWNTAFACLDPARDRPKLTILPETLVDRLVLDGTRAVGVRTDRGTLLADCVVLTAGAYYSPAILLRSGVGPERELRSHGIPVAAALPVGERLLDHCGSGVAWEPTVGLNAQLASDEPLFEPHAVVKAASSTCPPGTWDLHFLPWVSALSDSPGRYELSAGFFLMKPKSAGRLGLRSTDPTDLPVVERGFLSNPADLALLIEALELGRRFAATEPLSSLVAGEKRPGPGDPAQYLRETVRNYFHPAGTCAMGAVVDTGGRVLGLDNLLVADASIMPTIPRANTNLTVVAIAERLAEHLRS